MKKYLIIFFSLYAFYLNAQDIHFSQFQISKTLINPAPARQADNINFCFEFHIVDCL
jgi:hypothetical protein